MNWLCASENMLTGKDIHCICAITMKNSITTGIVNMPVVTMFVFFDYQTSSIMKIILSYVFLATLNDMKHN
jgi:hypothetical protein